MITYREIALLATLALAGCASSSEDKHPRPSFEIEAPSENVLWAVCGQEVQRLGFPVGSAADPATRRMLSGWRTSLAPFRGKGHRERAEVRLDSLGERRFKVEVRVESERNMNLSRPIDPAYAEWEAQADDESSAMILIQRIKGRLGEEIEVGPAPRIPGR
ncbi:MAG: hypothetical protein ACKO4Q_11050 [Planctomycetota bacterium]